MSKTDDVDAAARQAVTLLLESIGEDPSREGLRDTPSRVVRALREMTEGIRMDPAEILSTVFNEPYDQMVVLENISFHSLCEHHILPFHGTASVAYVPNGRVIGLSKMARLVDCFARRLQVQERMTEQIADALMEHLRPLGAGVVVRAHHSCMGSRGARKPNAVMLTSALRGYMLDDPKARAEFLQLCRVGGV